LGLNLKDNIIQFFTKIMIILKLKKDQIEILSIY